MLKYTDLTLYTSAGLCSHVRNRERWICMHLIKPHEIPSTAFSNALVMPILFSLIVPFVLFEFTFPYKDPLSVALELTSLRCGQT